MIMEVVGEIKKRRGEWWDNGILSNHLSSPYILKVKKKVSRYREMRN